MKIGTNASIDSMTIIVPLDSVEIVSNTFLQSYTKVYESGEIEDNEDFYNYSAATSCDGIKFKVAQCNLMNGTFKNQTCLQFVVTAKMLKHGQSYSGHQYFEGLNAANFYMAIDYINAQNIVKIPYEVAIKGICTDIDIKRDFPITKPLFDQEVILLKELTLSDKKKYIEVQNGNLMYNTRQAAKPSAPFVKFYFKTDELQNKSYEFYNKFLSAHRYAIERGLQRVEVTLKNGKHKQHHKVECKTVADLLYFGVDKLNALHRSILIQYFNKNHKLRTKNKMEIKDTLIISLIDCLIENGKSEAFIYSRLLPQFDDKVQRHRAKKHIEFALNEVTNKAKLLENNSAQKPIFDTLKELGIYDFENDNV